MNTCSQRTERDEHKEGCLVGRMWDERIIFRKKRL